MTCFFFCGDYQVIYGLQQLLSGIDDISKFGLQRRAADEESVNIGPSAEILAVLATYRATVDDLDILSHIGVHIVFDPGAQLLVNVLGLFGRRHHAGADCPDGFVGDDLIILIQKTYFSKNKINLPTRPHASAGTLSAIALICAKTTSSVLPASRSVSSSPMQGMMLRPTESAFATLAPISSSLSPKT